MNSQPTLVQIEALVAAGWQKPETITIEQFAQMARVSVITIRRWQAAGKMPDRTRRGHRLNYVKAEALSWFLSRGTP